jgi:hypothetical protein
LPFSPLLQFDMDFKSYALTCYDSSLNHIRLGRPGT